MITIKGGPWVALPNYFTYGSIGYMLSPTWLAQPRPTSHSARRAARCTTQRWRPTPADGDPAKPVGLGAFTFESYTPGNGNAFRAVRNEDYWRGPNGITGEDLPYLDAIEAVAAVDIDSRQSSLRSGEFDAMHTANSDAISQLLDDDGFKVSSSSRFGDTSYYMINVAAGPELDPEGKNAANPLLNVHCRRALAHAMDRERMTEERGAGLVEPANGPFPPGSIGYLEDNGYPEYDLDLANEEMDQCLGELGTDPSTSGSTRRTIRSTSRPARSCSRCGPRPSATRSASTITPIEQGQYIGLALVGDFNVLQGRGYSGLDPDQQRLWWQKARRARSASWRSTPGASTTTSSTAPLQIIKSNPDPAARKEAAETVNRRFGEQVYNWWWSWTLWGVATQPYVNGVERNVLPDGTKGIGLAFAGRHQVNQIWCDEGSCE